MLGHHAERQTFANVRRAQPGLGDVMPGAGPASDVRKAREVDSLHGQEVGVEGRACAGREKPSSE